MLGDYIVRLTVDDGNGKTATDTVKITVKDNTPPAINSVSASPSVLWPPNHNMRSVTVSVNVSDPRDTDVSCVIVSVTSNEPEGDNAPDWEITGDLTVKLRAERSGKGDGRVYTINVECTDDSGNSSESSVNVTVLHDQGKKK